MLSDIRVKDDFPRLLSTREEVQAAERQLGMPFPAGYEEFATALGEGYLEASGLRVYPPGKVLHELTAWRERIDSYWFWDAGADTLPKARALECVVVADTGGGDEFIVHPDDVDTVFVLPRHSDAIHRIPGGIEGVLAWLRGSGVPVEPSSADVFAPLFARWDAKTVYLLRHYEPRGDQQIARDIGTFESQEQLERARAFMLKQPGFRLAPEGFQVARYTLGEIDWTRGYYEPDVE